MTAHGGLRTGHVHGDRVMVTEPTTGVELFSRVHGPEAAGDRVWGGVPPLRLTLFGGIRGDRRVGRGADPDDLRVRGHTTTSPPGRPVREG